MHEALVDVLVHSPNEAADDLLLEGLRLGAEVEQSVIINAILQRKSVRGLSGVVERYDSLSERLQTLVLANIKNLHHALRECGRSDRPELRQAAMRLIALSRQCKLAYVLTENLHDADESLSKSAAEAIVALARWVSTGTRRLQRHYQPPTDEPQQPVPDADSIPAEPAQFGPVEPKEDFQALYRDVMEQRSEIETVVARAIDVHRGRHSQDLLRAALLLCDWPQSKTLAILQTTKHGGQSAMVRRLQQPPEAEHVEAFLLGATHGQLRLHFGTVFAHIDEAPVLDGILRKTHWLKDHQLQLCMHQVTRGEWWGESELLRDIGRRDADDACKIAEWLAASGIHDLVQDERMTVLAKHAASHPGGRLRLLRVAMRRKKTDGVQFLRFMLADADERLMRMAAREIVRRRPPDFENILLQLMTSAPASVRRVVSRSIGHEGFEQFWLRFDNLDRPTRKQGGRAMLKLLPDAAQRLGRRLASGPMEQRLKALQMTQELGLAEPLREAVTALASHPHPKVRSKAVSVLGETPEASVELLMERIVRDTDSRVRANAIEVLENHQTPEFIALLAERSRTTNSRERANAIKALHRMRVGNVGPALIAMLQDARPEHRISAMWALKQIGWWKLLHEVGRIAKSDPNLRARRYAVAVLKGVAEMVQAQQAPPPQSKGAA
ncbi:MAG: HEAT repeat domain-containing protein [Tepidisphaeraceae bacterium]|jgi:HEAT repeat protein